jgi:hypothetical protein
MATSTHPNPATRKGIHPSVKGQKLYCRLGVHDDAAPAGP